MLNESLWRLIGWTMIHFLWVGGGIAATTLLVRFTLRSAAPLARYTLTLIGFAALAAAPALIAGFLWQQQASHLPSRPAPPVAAVSQRPIGSERRRNDAVIDLAETPIFVDTQPAVRQWSPPPTVGAVEPTTLRSPPFERQLLVALDRLAGWLPLVWLIGAPLTFLLLATGLVGVERLRRDCRLVTDGPLHDAFAAAKGKLQLGGRVALAVSERVAQPVLVGVLRPLVLLPASAASGWTPEQLEMVLLHELAHARRWDNLVNLGQRVVESLLFFHPAVWLLSRWLRADREQCCDTLVVRLTEDPRSYAELLVAVAESTSHRQSPLAASAMASHPLARRVRRILQLEDEPMLVSKKLLITLVAVGLGLTGACGYTFSQGPESAAAPAQEQGERSIEAVEVVEDAGLDELLGAGVEAPPVKPSRADPQPPRNPHFLSLEDQRVADLAYNMLDIEVSPLDDDQAAAVKEKGFDGGLVVTKGRYGSEASGGPMPKLLIQHGDILVGLHVWPTSGFDGLSEVLRRDDLAEFNPLKFYVLRPTPTPASSRRGGGRGGYGGGRGGEMGSDTGGFGGGGEFGGEMGGGYGGEFGGGMGEFGGRSGSPAEPTTTYKLVTGRIAFLEDAWKAEQDRLKKLKPAGTGLIDPSARYVDPFAPEATPQPQPTLNPSGTYQPNPTPQPGSTRRRPPVSGSAGLSRVYAPTPAPRSGPTDQPSYGLDPGPYSTPQPSNPPGSLNAPTPAPQPPPGERIHDQPSPGLKPPETYPPTVLRDGPANYFQAPPLHDSSDQPTPTSRPPLAKLTYNGRTFDEWNTQWRTELSEEKRIEAVKALRAFARAGHWLVVGPSLLEVAEQYDAEKNSLTIVREIVDAFKVDKESPNDIAGLQFLLGQYLESPDQLLPLVNRVLLSSDFQHVDAQEQAIKLYNAAPTRLRQTILGTVFDTAQPPASEELLSLFRNALNDNNSLVHTAAARQAIFDLTRGESELGLVEDSEGPELLIELVFNEFAGNRRFAMKVITGVPTEIRSEVSKELLRVLGDPAAPPHYDGDLLPAETSEEMQEVRILAMNAIIALGTAAIPELEQLTKSDNEQLRKVAEVALRRIEAQMEAEREQQRERHFGPTESPFGQ